MTFVPILGNEWDDNPKAVVSEKASFVDVHNMREAIVVTSRRCQQSISGPETVTRLSGKLSSDDVTILSFVVILVIGGLFK